MATTSKKTVSKSADDASGDINTQRIAKCRTLGNGSQLTYEIGSDDKGQAYIKITAAAGGGFFSEEWISLPSIIAALDAWPAERPLSSNALAPLFRGKSANNPGFLSAVLVAEGVLKKVADKKRHLERGANVLSESTITKPRRRPSEGGEQKSGKVPGRISRAAGAKAPTGKKKSA